MVKLGGSAKFLSSKDVQSGDKVKFLDEGKWVESNKFKYPDGNWKKDFVITVSHNGEQKQWRLNATNRKILVEIFGTDETQGWLNKDVHLSLETALIGSERRKIIMVMKEGDEKKGVSWDE